MGKTEVPDVVAYETSVARTDFNIHKHVIPLDHYPVLNRGGISTTTSTDGTIIDASKCSIASVDTYTQVKLSAMVNNATPGKTVYMRLVTGINTGWTSQEATEVSMVGTTWTLIETDWFNLPAGYLGVGAWLKVEAGTAQANGFTFHFK